MLDKLIVFVLLHPLKFGTYTVNLVVTNANGCKDTATQTVTLTPKPKANFVVPNFNGCSNTNTINLSNTSVNAISYVWDFGDGNTSTLLNPAHTYSSAGTYTIKLYVTSVEGCVDSISRSISLAPKPVAIFAINATTQCANSSFIFTNNSITTGTAFYNWSFGDGSFSVSNSPSKTYSNAGNYTVRLIVTNANGCKDTATQVVTVMAKPIASFNIPFYNNCSDNITLNLVNTSANATSYNWNFGDGTTSILNNPVKNYSTSGTYSIQLIATSANGCVDTITKQVSFSAKPTALFSVNNNNQCVNNNSFRFINNSTISTGALQYLWQFGDGTTSIEVNPVKVYATAGTYSVKLTATGIVGSTLGCNDVMQITINVLAKPTSNFNVANSSICSSTRAIVFNNTSTNAANYIWNFGDGVGATTANPTYTYANFGNYTISLIANGSNGCSDTSSHSVNLLPNPVAAFDVNNNSQCLSKNSFVFVNNSIDATSYSWNFGDGVTSNFQNLTHIYSNAGTYTVTLVATNGNGCTSTATQTVTVFPTVVASFNLQNFSTCTSDNTVTLVNSSTSAANYTWDFGDGIGSNATNPTHTYSVVGTYTITLTATNASTQPFAFVAVKVMV